MKHTRRTRVLPPQFFKPPALGAPAPSPPFLKSPLFPPSGKAGRQRTVLSLGTTGLRPRLLPLAAMGGTVGTFSCAGSAGAPACHSHSLPAPSTTTARQCAGLSAGQSTAEVMAHGASLLPKGGAGTRRAQLSFKTGEERGPLTVKAKRRPSEQPARSKPKTFPLPTAPMSASPVSPPLEPFSVSAATFEKAFAEANALLPPNARTANSMSTLAPSCSTVSFKQASFPVCSEARGGRSPRETNAPGTAERGGGVNEVDSPAPWLSETSLSAKKNPAGVGAHS
mmetsp:Transcript_13733/g.35115  ORF Transcript_13733/g.35115 Transcript_13733/m.35115 type:complete len:282 (-) Transcript_13733:455-1300(-)